MQYSHEDEFEVDAGPEQVEVVWVIAAESSSVKYAISDIKDGIVDRLGENLLSSNVDVDSFDYKVYAGDERDISGQFDDRGYTFRQERKLIKAARSLYEPSYDVFVVVVAEISLAGEQQIDEISHMLEPLGRWRTPSYVVDLLGIDNEWWI